MAASPSALMHDWTANTRASLKQTARSLNPPQRDTCWLVNCQRFDLRTTRAATDRCRSAATVHFLCKVTLQQLKKAPARLFHAIQVYATSSLKHQINQSVYSGAFASVMMGRADPHYQAEMVHRSARWRYFQQICLGQFLALLARAAALPEQTTPATDSESSSIK